MKKFLIGILVLFVLMLGGAYVKLFSKQANYRQALDATSGGVLVLNNLDNANIKIVVAKTDKITVDLEGGDDLLSKTSLNRTNALLAEFGLLGDGTGVTGTITVPEGTVIDVNFSGGKNLLITDASGQEAVTGAGSYVIDTSTVSSVNVTSDGGVSVVGWGDVVILEDDWTPIEASSQGTGNDGPIDNPSNPTQVDCGVGSQSVRNYCCESVKENEPAPACTGFGHWVFNNALQACQFFCESEDEEEDCSIGSQLQRDSCCAAQHSGEYQGCIGNWAFNNSNHMCQFNCDSSNPDDNGVGNDSGSNSEEPEYSDPVSQFCSDIILDADKDTCCNDALQNPLSSGPRPGYPDCIGKYYFDSDDGCLFRCAEHTEMIQILNEIKQNLGQ